jgi:uncharacterized lipoprotein YehR (DUF1307 family)
MKVISKIALCLVLVSMLFTLVACGGSTKADGKLEGTYSGKYTYDGAEISVVITLKEDGTYTKDSTVDGVPSSTAGDYELKDGKVVLYTSPDHMSGIAYKYVDGHLENDYGKFVKK